MTTVVEIPGVPAAVSQFLNREHGLLIGGKVRAAADGATFETLDPSTAKPIARVAQAGQADVDAAVHAARTALNGEWKRMSPADRSRVMNRLADLIEADADNLATLETLDNGKPFTFSRYADLELTVAQIRYYAGWPTKITGEVVPVSAPDNLVYTRKVPVGVCAQIIPWNFPLLMASWKIAPALAAGCTIVLKPAEETPLTALRLGELALEAGIPAGVLNVLTGDGRTGAALVDHAGVDKISFTGSTAVGREIAAKAGRALKRVTLELGGKAPNIILPDADLDKAVEASFHAIYFNTGQACNAGSRLYVPRDQYDDVVNKLAAVAKATVPAPGLDPTSLYGPVISDEALQRIVGFVDAAQSDGVKLVTGGKRIDRDGYFIEPTLFSATSDNYTIAREEVFGPVLVALPYDTIDEVVERANATDYGLVAGVWTENLATAHQMADRLDAGVVYINQWHPSDPASPYGGIKASGIGREMGSAGLDAYLELKTIWTKVG